jgi:hypothetical protein
VSKAAAPSSRNQVASRLDKFRAFLVERGAEVLTPTNPWEVLRIRACGGVHVLYSDKGGALTSTPVIDAAWIAFRTNCAWNGASKTGRMGSRKRSVMARTLLERDGDACFYCGKPLGNDETVEHLMPRAQGGPNHIANCALAHDTCNKSAGHLSVMEKIKLRERMRSEKEGVTP